VIAERARWAVSGNDRRKGLLGTSDLAPGEGLIIDRGYQVHTIGMRYSIDVLFCDKRWRVKHVVESMRPRRVTRLVLGARYVVELPAGAVAGTLSRGDELRVEPVEP
jgi:uncharacterized membrane protein (UPF0127 family)